MAKGPDSVGNYSRYFDLTYLLIALIICALLKIRHIIIVKFVMTFPEAISPLEVSCRTVAPDDVIDWHAHWHDELCLVLEGTPTIGHAGSKLIPQDDTLFLFKEREEHGVWT